MPETLQTYDLSNILQPAQFPEDARRAAGKFGASLTLAKGTVLAKKSADGKLYAYDDATTAVSTAVGILEYSIKTDASGNVYFSTTSAVAGTDNPPHQEASFFEAGTFLATDLTGWDAAAATDLKARTLANGYYRIP